MTSPVCTGCGVQLPAALLSCHACGRLVHAAELKRLAAEAEAAHTAGDAATALARWRSALALLPTTSRQHGEVKKRLEALSHSVAAQPVTGPAQTPSAAPAWIKRLGPLGAVALFLWKFKFLALAILS